MKRAVRLALYLFLVTGTFILWSSGYTASAMEGEIAPEFSLQGVDGKRYRLSETKEQPMLILYFFDASSRPSQEGLLSLDKLAKKYDEADLTVWAITLSPREAVSRFLSQSSLTFPVLLDDSQISDLYQARLITPTVCVIGPGRLVMDYFQGGGKTTEIMLVRLAERKLRQRQTRIARAISREVSSQNPKNAEAKSLNGYAALEEGDLKEAEKAFGDLSKEQGEAEILGKEGLAKVYASKGETKKALEMVRDVEKKAPDRGFVQVVKGDVLASQNKEQEAQEAYRKGVEKKTALPFQKAVAYNQLGRFHASLGKYDQARELYDQAVEIDPYYIEATSNKGVAFEKQGRWSDALSAYRKALDLNRQDTFTQVLARKAEQMLALQKDIAEKKRIDKLVKELASRYQSQKTTPQKADDGWTSRPMILSFVDFAEKGGLAQRDGFSTVLTAELTAKLNATGRVRVVERVLVERLLEELNLGSSDLADPDTALRLGKVLAAKLLGTGSLFYLPNGSLLTMRFIDTETSAVPKVITKQIALGSKLDKELNELNRTVLKGVMETYPLQGYIVQTENNEAMLNIGAKQGVVLGTRFAVLEEQEPIKYKGKLLHSAPKAIGELRVVRVEPDLCYARIVTVDRPLERDDKVKELVEQVVATVSQ